MQASEIPSKFPVPWGNQATSPYIRSIPETTSNPVAASLQLGFPPDTATPIAAGGTPPDVRDMNGILNQVTAWLQWIQAGGGPVGYDATFQSEIGGYPMGAIVASAATFGRYWLCLVDNNTSDPDTGGAGWQTFPFAQSSLAHGECVFSYTSASVCTLSTKNGCNLLIGGTQYQLPAAGISFGNTGVYVNGVAGQNLAVNTVYYSALAYIGGQLTPGFWTFGTYTHAPDTTAGNVGTEVIWQGSTPETGWTLVGMMATNASGQFQPGLMTLSWFNRHDKTATVNATGLQTGSYSWADLGSHVPFLTWGDEAAIAETDGYAGSNTGAGTETGIGIDSSANIGGVCNGSAVYPGNACAITCAGFFQGLSEGLHTAIVFGLVTSGSGATGTWGSVWTKVKVRG